MIVPSDDTTCHCDDLGVRAKGSRAEHSAKGLDIFDEVQIVSRVDETVKVAIVTIMRAGASPGFLLASGTSSECSR